MMHHYQPEVPNKAQKAVPSAMTPGYQRRASTLAALYGRGFGIIETIVVLSVTVSLISLGARYLRGSIDQSIHQATANHLKKIDKAANAYVRDHYQAHAAGPSELTINTLIKAGYLPTNIRDSNHYQQRYKIKVTPKKQDQRELLQVVLTTQDGQKIAEGAMRKITDLVGGQAGYATLLAPDKIIGAQEGWEMESSEAPLAVGHLATVNLIDQQEVVDAESFLRRKKFPGHPEYNKMKADLEMAKDKRIFFSDNGFEIANDEIKLKDTGRLDENSLVFNGDGDNYIAVVSGSHNYFGTKYGADEAKLWSNYMSIIDEDQDRGIIINNQNLPYIEVKHGDNNSILRPDQLIFSSFGSDDITIDSSYQKIVLGSNNIRMELNSNGIDIVDKHKNDLGGTGVNQIRSTKLKSDIIQIPHFLISNHSVSGNGITNKMKWMARKLCPYYGAGGNFFVTENKTNYGGPIFCLAGNFALLIPADTRDEWVRPVTYVW